MSDGVEQIRPWILIPIYEHGATIGGIVGELAEVGLPCLIVDDGSSAPTRAVLDDLAATHDWVRVERLSSNCGKGVALRHGFRVARAAGATHVVHLDADGQHDIADVPRFIAAIRDDPDALILGKPIFDDTVPAVRLYGRQFSRWSVWLCTRSFAIDDPLCGFRAVPLDATLAAIASEDLGDRMQFEPGLTVVCHWAGMRIRNLPTRVRYVPGGLSHFDAVRDTLRMVRLYVRLLVRGITRLFTTETQRHRASG